MLNSITGYEQYIGGIVRMSSGPEDLNANVSSFS